MTNLETIPFLPSSYDWGLVGLSILIAIIASLTAIIASLTVLNMDGFGAVKWGWHRLGWTLGGAAAMGTGIWAMHFTGMLAFHLPLPVVYDFPLTVLSYLAAVAGSGIGIFVVSRPTLSAKTLILGSSSMGLGITIMHYTGMAGMRLQAIIHWNNWLISFSVLMTIMVSLCGLWFVFQMGRTKIWQNLGGAAIMGLAIPSMHNTAMAAASFQKTDEYVRDFSDAITISTLGSTVTILSTFLILGFTLMLLLMNRKLLHQAATLEELSTRNHLLLNSMEEEIFGLDMEGKTTFINRAGAR
ncbi:MAG: MHYT domain-containing protein, partial [Nitrospirota bacterium]|nr:MHYT domain-containing protein [Nitrospirota bacterium]